MNGFDAKEFLRGVPDDPGVYRMFGAGDVVLYVGKAKNLKKRLSSYFRGRLASPRIAMMVGQIERVETTPTRSEAEALILENNLIKSLAPRYNILFRDDKSYPYITLTAHSFPRLAFHRGGFARGARYFGPFPSSVAVRESIHLLQKVLKLRTCENAVFNNRSRPCLLHQIDRCKAPCVGLISADDYAADVQLATLFLEGRTSEVVNNLTARMQKASEALDFEAAAALRDQVRALQQVLHKQYVDSGREEDVDILTAVASDGQVCVNLAMVRGGRHLGDRPQIPAAGSDVPADDALLAFVEQHYAVLPVPARIVTSVEPARVRAVLAELGKHSIVVGARREIEKGWLEMAGHNAQLAIQARQASSDRSQSRLVALQNALELEELPTRIECFDISHTMGEATVASCVVCDQGAMKRSEYRRYNITGVTPGDDYAAMRQVLTRRYEKVAAGEGVRPDLVLVDGGRGQLGMARDVFIELGLEALPAVGVAKGEGRKPGLESLIFTDGRPALHLDPASAALHLVQEIRDEAHRFAITGHRAKRGKARVGSHLERIPGVGPARRRILLAAFGGLEGVRAATIEDLCRVDGINRTLAELIHAELARG